MFKKIIFSLGHSVLLILLHIIYFNLNWSVPLEYEMMMAMNKAESFVGGHGNFEEGNYLFINTAYDVTLIRSETEYGDSGLIPVTDRRLLAEFFEKLTQYGNLHKYVLCDILFDKRTNEDSFLNKSFERLSKAIIPSEYDKEEHHLKAPFFKVKSAQADYITYEGLV